MIAQIAIITEIVTVKSTLGINNLLSWKLGAETPVIKV